MAEIRVASSAEHGQSHMVRVEMHAVFAAAAAG